MVRYESETELSKWEYKFRLSPRAARLASIVFIMLGAGFLIPFVIAWQRSTGAQEWAEVPCEVVESRVLTSIGENSDGITRTYYSPLVVYGYDYNGRSYKSSRYSFMGSGSSDEADAEQVVASHPPGTQTVCYVNPSDPSKAVLDTGLPEWMWMIVLPVALITVGVLGVLGKVPAAKQAPAS